MVSTDAVTSTGTETDCISFRWHTVNTWSCCQILSTTDNRAIPVTQGFAHLWVSQLGDVIHPSSVLLPLSSEVQHTLPLNAGPLILHPDVTKMVGELEGVRRCVCGSRRACVCAWGSFRCRRAFWLLLSLQCRGQDERHSFSPMVSLQMSP